MNRWTLATTWTIAMLLACRSALLQAGTTTTLVLLWAVGATALFAVALMLDSETPRSISAILNDLESDATRRT